MSPPQAYIDARRNAKSTNPLHHVILDEKPYFPFLTVDPSDHSSILYVVAQFVRISRATGLSDDNDASCWPVSQVQGGITNQLFRVDMSFKNGVGKVQEPYRESILVRVFGAVGMIDRDIENATFAALTKQGLAPAYFGRFSNGRLEAWCDGMRPLTTRELAEPAISKQIAHELRRIHARFELPADLKAYHSPKRPNLWTQLHAWMEQASVATFLTDKDTQRANQLELKDVPKEIQWLKQTVVPVDAQVSFCHNDALAANILYNPTTGNIRLIDFEYGGMNYIAFDIANHWNEFAGGTDTGITNYDWFPTKDQQLFFLRSYLEKEGEQNGDATVVQELYHQVQAFILVNHLYWGLWAFNQAAVEGCERFDYLLYAKNRLARYFDCKSERKDDE